MIHPVVRVFLERAAGRRASLLELAAAIPTGYWARRARPGEWSAREHLAHALSVDQPLILVVDRAARATSPILLVESLEHLEAQRVAVLAAAAGRELGESLAEASAWRGQLSRALHALPPGALDRELIVPGVVGAWGEPKTVTLLAYLEQWSVHDQEHEQAIRAAVATSPDLSAVAYVRRLR